MDEATELAKTLKKLGKKPLQQGVCIGKVVCTEPIKISTINMLFEFDKENLIAVGDIKIKMNDHVVLLPTDEGQKYFLLGKVGGVSVSSE